MNLKQSPERINSLTVRHFTQLLTENKKFLLADISILSEITKLKQFLTKLEDIAWEERSKIASKKLTQMTEEERRIILMTPEEKQFFLQYKKQNPDNPSGYFKEYQKSIQNEYERSGKLT